ncbi:hypothetical protein SF23_18565 [Streptomyces sp. MBRL 10]|nr:hypothetical protein SF23_18565 [Streptomyces sp. MBRL 10]
MSETSVITRLKGGPHGTLDACRASLAGATARRASLATAEEGSEFCVRTPAGDVALLAVQVKAIVNLAGWPDRVTMDMTVWRKAAAPL